MDNISKSLIKRTILFLLLASFLVPCIGLILGLPVAIFISSFICKTTNFWDGFSLIYYTLFIESPFVYYICAKIFGLFKLLDEFKTTILNKILLLTLISILLFIELNLVYFGVNNLQFDFVFIFGLGFNLIPAFLLYKFFQYLTKKYPQPFEIIGYYFSIEFYKKVFIQSFNKFKKN